MTKKGLFPKAGRELDSLIAEKVMGWRWFDCIGIAVLCPPFMIDSWLEHPVLQKPIDSPEGRFREHVDGVKFFDSSYRANNGKTKPEFPEYSTGIEPAISVFEHHFTEWQVERLANCLYVATGWIGDQKFEAKAKTIPLAICRAALLPLKANDSTSKARKPRPDVVR